MKWRQEVGRWSGPCETNQGTALEAHYQTHKHSLRWLECKCSAGHVTCAPPTSGLGLKRYANIILLRYTPTHHLLWPPPPHLPAERTTSPWKGQGAYMCIQASMQVCMCVCPTCPLVDGRLDALPLELRPLLSVHHAL